MIAIRYFFLLLIYIFTNINSIFPQESSDKIFLKPIGNININDLNKDYSLINYSSLIFIFLFLAVLFLSYKLYCSIGSNSTKLNSDIVQVLYIKYFADGHSIKLIKTISGIYIIYVTPQFSNVIDIIKDKEITEDLISKVEQSTISNKLVNSQFFGILSKKLNKKSIL